MPTEKGTVQASKFQKVRQVIVAIFILPALLVSALSAYILRSTNQNSLIPTGFGFSVITVNQSFDNYVEGQKVLVQHIPASQINPGDSVAFYKTSEEDEEVSEVVFKIVSNVTTQNGRLYFAFSGTDNFIPDQAIIGVHKVDNNLILSVIDFFSNQTRVIFVGLMPLFIMLLLLGFDIVEQIGQNRMNKEIELALSKVGSAGFDTSVLEENVEQKSAVAQTTAQTQPKTMPEPKAPPKPVAPIPTKPEQVAKPEPPVAPKPPKPVAPKPEKPQPAQPVPPKPATTVPPKPGVPPVPPTPQQPPKPVPPAPGKPPVPPKR
jgi:hypothetical protein